MADIQVNLDLVKPSKIASRVTVKLMFVSPPLSLSFSIFRVGLIQRVREQARCLGQGCAEVRQGAGPKWKKRGGGCGR